ncbi:hypothetical protein Val02_03950 [Virgisporangium aliadipatigenens]|uniref:Winged helix-turn-helix domain-containing protein n=1 Tax=Virgisporangium aliadipatigenens TaxID=741659 RepID=A0A8J4DML4_9ACTN|nr:crosslink repair DNA glycosylase YcaQ family protein [Virgisporangium aliadipatigenens]GIJ43509.1 hypothetical protein Val02_03950 [Virgisporangium aliadipatigenens]
MALLHIDRTQARRIAVRAQLLDATRPTGLLDTLRRLTLLQIDPTAAIAPNADLVAWSRLADAYDPSQLQQAVERDRSAFELGAMIRPIEDLRLYLPDMHTRPRDAKAREWLAANATFHRDVLALLAEKGPLLSRDIPDTSTVPWPSSGWTDNRNVTQLLEILNNRGEVAISARRGRQRLFDLASRVYPTVAADLSVEEAARLRDERRLGALGIARARTTAYPVEPADVGEAGEEATVEGTKGTWRVDPTLLGQPFEGRTALLSPFDRLVHDRTRIEEIFEYEYTLEMYKPAAKRRWGYFALPILHGDRLVGKLDATADRKAGVLRVNAIHEDAPFPRAAVDDEIAALAAWLGLDVARAS